MLYFSFFTSVTHLSPSPAFVTPLPFYVSLLPVAFPGVRPQHKFIGGGRMPVEVKSVSGSLSDAPIILYGSSSGRAFITLNYMLRLLRPPSTPPPPPAHAGRPWPYHSIILPRRNVIQATLDI